MRIKALMNFRCDPHVCTKDDVVTVTDDLGGYFCRAGWAEDVEGVVPTGAPDKSDVVLKVQSNKRGSKVETANG